MLRVALGFRLQDLPGEVHRRRGLASVGGEGCDRLVARICLCVPKKQYQAFLGSFVLFGLQTVERRLEPVVLIGRQQHLDEGVVLLQRQNMLRDEDFEVGVIENVKRGVGRVVPQTRHSVDLKKVILRLYIPQVAVRHGSERDLSVCRRVRQTESQHASVIQKERGIVKIREFLPQRGNVSNGFTFYI